MEATILDVVVSNKIVEVAIPGLAGPQGPAGAYELGDGLAYSVPGTTPPTIELKLAAGGHLVKDGDGLAIDPAVLWGVANGGTGAATFTAGYLKSPGGTNPFTTVSTIPYADLTGVEAAGTAASTMSAHLLASDPHSQYALDSDLASHIAAGNPHPQYTLLTDLAAHVAAADPHPAYLLESAAANLYQPLDSDLTDIAALATSAYGRSFLTLADPAAARVYVGYELLVPGTDTLEQYNGANAQSWFVYNTRTSAVIYERAGIWWTSNVVNVGVQAVGAGSSGRELRLRTHSGNITTVMRDSNYASIGMYDNTGTIACRWGISSTYLFSVASANGATTYWGVSTSALQPGASNSYDLGTSSFTVRDAYLGRNLFLGTTSSYLSGIASISHTPTATSGTNVSASVYRTENPASNSTATGVAFWVENIFAPSGTVTGSSLTAIYGRVRSEGTSTGTLGTASSFSTEFIQSAGNRTVSNVYGLAVTTATVSVGTVTLFNGVMVFNQSSANIGTAYAFRSQMASGTGRWNLYMEGTATNYMAGALYIGATAAGTVTSAVLRVAGQAQFDGNRTADTQYTAWFGKTGESGSLGFNRGSDGQATGIVGYLGRATATDFWVFSGGGSGTLTLATGGGNITASIASTNRMVLASTYCQFINPFYIDSGSPQVRVRYFNSPTYGDMLRISSLPTGSGSIIDVVNSSEAAYAPLTLTGSSIALSVNGTVSMAFAAASTSLNKSVAGGTWTFSLQNTSNTAGSYTRFQVYAAGSTADDAVVNIGIVGVQDYYIGVDNSASDKLVLGPGFTPGAADAIRIPASGAVEFPQNVAFGVFTGTGDVAINGFLTVFDLAGNARKLATVA